MTDLKQLAAEVDTYPVLATGQGGTAELLNEDDEQGDVLLRDKGGVPRILMSRVVYEQLRDKK